MAAVVQAPCPGCKRMLRFPSGWLRFALRCKNCGTVLQVRQKVSSAGGTDLPSIVPSPAAPPMPVSLPATRAAPPRSAPPGTPFAPANGSDSGAANQRAAGIRSFILRRRSNRVRETILICGLLLAAAALAGYLYGPQLWGLGASSDPGKGGQASLPAINTAHKGRPSAGGVLPRRVLAISVNNHLYANPVGCGSPERNIHTLAERMADVLHVHPSQIVELCDSISPKSEGRQGNGKSAPRSQCGWVVTPKPPLKSVIEKTVNAFLESCRRQDHILVLFIGHIIDLGEEAYLVPLEGELAVKETLIPLRWLYEQLARCRARQKVLIVDSCRYDPSRGLERPGGGPMSATVDGLFHKPPAGLQVWSACSSGQYSYELDGSGVFLDKLYDALAAPELKKVQNPEDRLPLEGWAQVVNQSTTTEAASQICSSDGQKAVQTPQLSGQMPEDGAPYDKDEPLPRRIEIPGPTFPSGAAQREQVRSIIQEIDLPPIRLAQVQPAPLHVENLLPFSAHVILRYRPDYQTLGEIDRESEKYPLRTQILQTVKLLRRTFDPDGPERLLRDYFQGSSNERIKAAIFKEQMKPARVLEELTERLEALRNAGLHRDKERSLRWQAHYDYILAQLLARTAYVSEYNLMLGKIRKDELPELRLDVHTGWRLASCEKMQSGKDVREMAAESKKLFAKLIAEHPGTPWEVLAKREKLTSLGLEWQPSR